jgi:hypothetical protein
MPIVIKGNSTGSDGLIHLETLILDILILFR